MKRILLLLALSAMPVSATVYKCETAAGTTYSQLPCADDAQVTDYSRENTEPPLQTAQTPAATAASDTIDRIAIGIKKRDLTEKINRLERQRDRQVKNRDDEVAKINSQRGRYVQNLYGVAHDDKVNSSIVAATTIWNSRIEATDRELDQLRAEFNKL
ncbi:DUF4124 domain-containing protein [Rheinheimera baltica]|uniref:DUF4124 domain-containing protein n=1 Tax=Rheinheimera baltica TaxID=67576 RepID=UPI000426B8E3|nr:DUF4124 domain-containing protein [Rheinheimera baltica]